MDVVPLTERALHDGRDGVCLSPEGEFWHSNRALDIRCPGCRIVAQAAINRVDPVLQTTVLHIDMDTDEASLMPLGLAVEKDLASFMRRESHFGSDA